MNARILALAILAGCFLSRPALAREWSDTSGKFRTEAEFAGMQGTKVLLKKPNGVTVGVPLDKLSPADQAVVKQLLAKSGDLPADVAIQSLMNDVEQGRLRALWDALPASYQKDVNSIIQTFAENMDTGIWNAGFRVTGKTLTLLKTKKQFIFGNADAAAGLQAAQAQGGKVDPKALQESIEDIVKPFETLVTSDLAKLDKLKTLDVGTFLDTTGVKFGEQMVALGKRFAPPDLLPATANKPKVTLLSSNGDQATIRVETVTKDGETKTEETALVRVNGKWLPKGLVDGWQDGLAKATEALAGLKGGELQKNKPKFMQVIGMIEGAVGQLQQTETQEQFDQAVGQYKLLFGAMVPQGGPAGPGPGGPARPGAVPGKPPANDPFGQ